MGQVVGCDKSGKSVISIQFVDTPTWLNNKQRLWQKLQSIKKSHLLNFPLFKIRWTGNKMKIFHLKMFIVHPFHSASLGGRTTHLTLPMPLRLASVMCFERQQTKEDCRHKGSEELTDSITDITGGRFYTELHR